MTDNDVVQPLGRIVVKVKCNNPKCKEQFEADKEEGIFQCPNCGKLYYIRKTESQIWIKAIGTRSGSDTSDKRPATY